MGICNCKECIEDFFKDNDILMENGEKKESREQKLKSSKNNNMEINNINIIDLEEKKVDRPNQMEEEEKLLNSHKKYNSNRHQSQINDLEPKDTDDINLDKESNNQQSPQQQEEMNNTNQDQEKEQEREKDNKISLEKKEKNPIDSKKKRLNTSPCVVNNIKTENLQTNQEMEKNQRDDEEGVNNYGLDEPKEEILQHNYLSPNKFKVETHEPNQIRDNILSLYNNSAYKTKTEDSIKKGPKDSLNPKCQVFPHKKKKKSFLSQNEPIDTDKKIQKIQNYQNRHKSVDQGIKTLREFGPKDSQKKDEDNFNLHCDKQESTDYIYNNQNVGAIDNADLGQMNYNQNNFININNENNYIIQQQQYNNYQEGNNQQSYLPLIMNSIMNNSNNNNLNGFQVYNNEEYFQNMQNNNNMEDY